MQQPILIEIVFSLTRPGSHEWCLSLINTGEIAYLRYPICSGQVVSSINNCYIQRVKTVQSIQVEAQSGRNLEVARQYFGGNAARLWILALSITALSLLLAIPASRIILPALDLDGAGSFFPSVADIYWRNPVASPLYLLAILIPLVPLPVPPAAAVDAPAGQAPALAPRLAAMLLSLPPIVVYCICEAYVLATPMYTSVHTEYRLRTELIPWAIFYLACAIFLLQRFWQPGRRPTASWIAAYASWAVSFLLLKNCTWDIHYDVFQRLYFPHRDYLVFLVGFLPLLAIRYAGRLALPVYIFFCLNPLFFAFVYGHFSSTGQASRFAIMWERLGWIVLGTEGTSIGHFVDLIQ